MVQNLIAKWFTFHLRNTPYTRAELIRIRNSNDFYCPSCNEKLIIKIGTEITPHFSHRSSSTCTGGGEGVTHQSGKWLLYSWLKSQYEHVAVESYLQEINQRPDILLSIGTRKYAIEFQFSSVSTSDIRKRNTMYKQARITPIWLLDVKHLKQQSSKGFILNSFVKQFLFHPLNHQSPIVLFFCTKKAEIISIQDILFISTTKALGTKQVYPLDTYRWDDIYQKRSSLRNHYLRKWTVEKKKFRMRPRYGVGKQKEWLVWLYERQIPIDYLPSVVYLPVKGQMVMNVPPWDWQSRLWFFIQYKVGTHKDFTLHDCLAYLSSFMHPQDYYPLLKATYSPVTSYIDWLLLLGYVQRKDEHIYTLRRNISPHTHIEEAMTHDRLLMNHIMQLYHW